MDAAEFLQGAMAGRYGTGARQDVLATIEQADSRGYAHDAERIMRDLDRSQGGAGVSAIPTEPEGDLDTAARVLFEACEIGFERWEDVSPHGRALMRQRAQRVVEAFHGQTRAAGTPAQGYLSGRRCRSCGCSYDRCCAMREDWAEWIAGRELRDRVAMLASPQACCPSCQVGPRGESHGVVSVAAEQRPTPG